MSKFYYLVLALLCLWIPGRAQVVEDSVSLEVMLDTAFSELNLSYVPSGILIDKVPAYVDPTYFRGATPLDSIWLPGFDFAMFYGMIDRAHIGSSPLEDIGDWWDTFEAHEESDTLKLGLLWYAYDRLRADAIEEDLISFSVDRFYDVPMRPQHPYVPDTLFAASVMRYWISGAGQLIHYDTSLYFSNLAGTAPTLEIDAGDGLGWRSISPDSTLSVTFPQDTFLLIKVRLLSAYGRDWYVDTGVEQIGEGSTFQDDDSGMGGFRTHGYSFSPDDSITTVSGGTLYVFYNHNCAEPKLRKPLILIEGFDHDNKRDWKFMLGPQGALLELPYEASKPIKDFIHDGNYDIIYVDFDDGSADIIDNAQFVKDAIREINAIKATNGSIEKNVVIGASMGGVVGKWALREMEIAEEDHETEMYITFDAPMRGANIPMGLQAFLRDLSSVRIFEKTPADRDTKKGRAAKAGWETINSPAAKQLFYYHIDGCNGNLNCDLGNISSLHSAFYTQFLALDDLVIPEYAIINGAITGAHSEEFSAGNVLLEEFLTAGNAEFFAMNAEG